MNSRRYWKNRLPFLLTNLVCMAALTVFLLVCGNSVSAVVLILIVWALILLAGLVLTYWKRKRQMKKLLDMAEQLSERYLISEVMELPEQAEDQVYYQLLKMAGKSMLEQIGEVERERLEYKENIALALTINKVPAGEIDGRVREMAGKLNITDILDKYPYQVSGGQKQRCACARAIINQPKLILADEPTGALDSHSSQMLLSTIQSINEDLGATILMVTHDAFSASYAKRILFLRDGAIFMEILKGSDSRKAFFEKILDVLTMMGGGANDVR